MDVSGAVRAAIDDHGPISFAEFMELALYGPGGFYEQPPVGEDGHFTTSPHIHPVFSRLLADALGGLWTALDRPASFRLIELGAGDGTLAERVLKNLPADGARYTAVEQSEIARAAIQDRGLSAVRDLAALADLADTSGAGPATLGPACVFANELLDNLPFRRVRADERGTVHEICVGASGNRFVEVEVPCPPEIQPSLEPGREATVPVEAFALLEQLAAVVRRGYLLFIDYGSSAGTDAESAGDVHGYRDQRLVEDVLDAPGTADITAGVDFVRIANRAARVGFEVFPAVSQRDALMNLGFARWNDAERARQTALHDEGSGADAVRAWGSRNEANVLVDPNGLGRLQWLLLATPGLPAPAWLAASLVQGGDQPGQSRSKGASS